MDPISVAASVITVATLAGQVCSVFGELRSLCRSLPGRLAAVNNEVADLELVLYEVASLVERQSSLPDPDSKKSPLPHLVKQAGGKLRELQAVVDRLRVSYRDALHPLLAANLLRKEQSHLQLLQQQIRSVKCDLNILLGASHSCVAGLPSAIIQSRFE